MAFKVGTDYRTNELSFHKGGVTVLVKQTNGQVLEYDNIKNPRAYINKVSRNSDVEYAWVKQDTTNED